MMATLHGILAELGLAQSAMHFDPDREPGWITEPRFDPEEGASYELAFTRIPPSADEPPVIKRVRTWGPSAADWLDLDTHQPLDPVLYAYAVKAYRRLDDEERDEPMH